MNVVCRGTLDLGATLSGPALDASLLDYSDRRVRKISPGPNDLSRLPAGVYFVHARHGAPLGRVVLGR